MYGIFKWKFHTGHPNLYHFFPLSLLELFPKGQSHSCLDRNHLHHFTPWVLSFLVCEVKDWIKQFLQPLPALGLGFHDFRILEKQLNRGSHSAYIYFLGFPSQSARSSQAVGTARSLELQPDLSPFSYKGRMSKFSSARSQLMISFLVIKQLFQAFSQIWYEGQLM